MHAPFFFDAAELDARARASAPAFAAARPFPHVVWDDLLPADVALHAAEVFPPTDHPCWLDWRLRDTAHQPRKQGIGDASRLPGVDPWLRQLLHEFNGAAFIGAMETLTGLAGLVPDPYFIGGGLHQILPGGKLVVHADFNFHERLRLYRRINALVYLNPQWLDAWGGALELWDAEKRTCERTIAPVLNRCVIFFTDRRSLHGHPTPLACPEGKSRKSLAFYYYSAEPWPDQAERFGVDWIDTPAAT